MTRFVPSTALIASCAIGACGLVAVPAAEAQTSNAPVITPATSITPESATLNGVVDSGSLLPGTDYVFEYDTLSDYNKSGKQFGDDANFAPDVPGYVDANTGLWAISEKAGCYPVSVCNAQGEIPLQPNTTYVYQLQAQAGTAAGAYYATEALDSPIKSFKTPALGNINLGKTAKVSGNRASENITDSSVETAKGTWKVTVKVKRKTYKLGNGKFSIQSHATKTVTLKLSKAVTAALKAAKGHKLTAKVALTTSTDQKIKKTTSITLK